MNWTYDGFIALHSQISHYGNQFQGGKRIQSWKRKKRTKKPPAEVFVGVNEAVPKFQVKTVPKFQLKAVPKFRVKAVPKFRLKVMPKFQVKAVPKF